MDTPTHTPTRRGVVTALAATTAAGCSGLVDTSTPTPTPSYDALESTPTCRGDDVSLALPDAIPRAESPTDAGLVVVHGDPSVIAERAIAWLADGRVVALLGADAGATWSEWRTSEAYDEAFADRGRGESDPEPRLLVAGADETTVRTNRYSWGELPSNAELLRSLDEALVDITDWRQR